MASYQYGRVFHQFVLDYAGFTHISGNLSLKIIEVEYYQHHQTTSLQLGTFLWPCTFKIMVHLSSFLDLN